MSNDLIPSVPRTRTRWSGEERAEWLRLFEESGKTLSEFCRESNLSESTLSLWRKQQREPSANADDSFVEVELPSAAVPSASIAIRIGDIAIDVPVGTDAASLSDVLARMRLGA